MGTVMVVVVVSGSNTALWLTLQIEAAMQEQQRCTHTHTYARTKKCIQKYIEIDTETHKTHNLDTKLCVRECARTICCVVYIGIRLEFPYVYTVHTTPTTREISNVTYMQKYNYPND